MLQYQYWGFFFVVLNMKTVRVWYIYVGSRAVVVLSGDWFVLIGPITGGGERERDVVKCAPPPRISAHFNVVALLACARGSNNNETTARI